MKFVFRNRVYNVPIYINTTGFVKNALKIPVVLKFWEFHKKLYIIGYIKLHESRFFFQRNRKSKVFYLNLNCTTNDNDGKR